MYLQQCMLGPNIYGVPISQRSDGQVIATSKNMANWMEYPLPKPKPRYGDQHKKTCFKPLGLFVVDARLQCIQAFNHGADPWNLLGAREKPSAVSITYDKEDVLLHIGAKRKEQRALRNAYVLQCQKLRIPVPTFKGLLRDLPAYNNVPLIE